MAASFSFNELLGCWNAAALFPFLGDFGMADEEKEAIEIVNRLLTAGDPLGAAKQLKRLQKTVEGLPIPQEVVNLK